MCHKANGGQTSPPLPATLRLIVRESTPRIVCKKHPHTLGSSSSAIMRVGRTRYALVEHEGLPVSARRGSGDPTKADASEANKQQKQQAERAAAQQPSREHESRLTIPSRLNFFRRVAFSAPAKIRHHAAFNCRSTPLGLTS